jgi:tetratricopeptide (TPR) repeat protein
MRILFVGFLASLAAIAPASAQEDELARHLETMQRRVNDPAVPIADRERTAIEVASTLERAAGTAKTPDARRARLDQAADWLNAFNDKNPGHPEEPDFRRRIARIHFTEAESWAFQADLQPTLADPPRRALQSLQKAEAELRDILRPPGPAADSSTAQRVKATLARVLAMSAERDPPGRESLSQAVSLLEDAGDDRTGEDQLLRIDLLRRLGRLDEAERLLKALGEGADPPSPLAMLPVKVRLAIAKRQFDEALKSVNDSGRPIRETAPLAVEIRLAQRDALQPGTARRNAEHEAFDQLLALRDVDPLRYRITLFRLVRVVMEPAANSPPQFWGVLGEGHFLLGEPEQAARLWSVGAARAATERQEELAWDFRFRAAAAWFDAGEFGKAADLWNRVERSTHAAALRPKAGLLRATALRRIWRDDPTMAHRAEYFAALQDQIREFPNDPTAGQARYALGAALEEIGEDSQAIEAFRLVPAGHARRLDALRAIALILRRRLEVHAAIADPDKLRSDQGEAEDQIKTARAEFSADPAAKAELDLDLVRLWLIPNLSTLATARDTLNRLRDGPLREPTRRRADVLQVQRLLREEAFPEAEKLTRTFLDAADESGLEDLAEFVDALASNTTSDVMSRRCGGILDQVVGELRTRPAGEAPELPERLILWKVRSLLFRANSAEARRAAEAIHAEGSTVNLALRADTWLRLGEFARAEQEFRKLGRSAAAGSLSWFAARYGLVVSLTKEGKTAEAGRLIDGTALLAPDLGGPILKQRFEALRKRLPSR